MVKLRTITLLHFECYRRALHSLTLVTAYQVFKDVVEKTDKALQFYKQSLSLVDALSKGVSIIEETGKRLIFNISFFEHTFFYEIIKFRRKAIN